MILGPDDIQKIHAEALKAGLASKRDILRSGLDPSYVARLPNSLKASDSDRLLDDLSAMNQDEPYQGELALERWLRNASHESTGRSSAKVFLDWAEKVVDVAHKAPLANSEEHVSDGARRWKGPPGPITNVPIREPLYFLGREKLLTDIETELTRQRGRLAIAVLHGMPGIGKTALAAVYAHRRRDQYRATWWIRAHTESTLRSDLVELGIKQDWVAAGHHQEPALARVMECLRYVDETLLLIFDHAKDVDTIERFLPIGGGGQHPYYLARQRLA